MMPDPPYRLAAPPSLGSRIVFSSPHSGRAYPQSLIARSRLDLAGLRASEDVFVDELFDAAPEHGAPLLCALAPRAWVDLNRDPMELDPVLIEGVRAAPMNQRVAAGLGVVPRVVSEGREIYEGRIPIEEAEARIASVHAPYHAMLETLLREARARFGSAVLYDCHSMPPEALRAAPRVRGRLPEIVLGDRFGASAGRGTIARTQEAFERAGFTVARNAPFAGGYITQRYGRPSESVHAVQIEINRALYLDARTFRPGPDFELIRRLIGTVVADLVSGARNLTGMAAE
jgi:N-formylglutamate deformylase